MQRHLVSRPRTFSKSTPRSSQETPDRHIIVDTLGLMVGLMVHSADIQDRDGAPDLLKSIHHRWPWLLHVFADGGYAGDKLKRRLKKIGRWTIEIIKRSDKAKGFEVLISTES
jgi:transposase